MEETTNSVEQNGKNFYDIAIALYDKAPFLTSTVLLLLAITPMVLGWFSYLKKKEHTELEKFKFINEKRKSPKKRKKQ